jgi:hypothetical protein
MRYRDEDDGRSRIGIYRCDDCGKLVRSDDFCDCWKERAEEEKSKMIKAARKIRNGPEKEQ